MIRGDFDKRRSDSLAPLAAVLAAWMEMASRRRIKRRRYLATDRFIVTMADFQPWNALKQGFGVGMIGLLDKCLDWCGFDDAP